MAGIYIHVPYCKQRCIYCDFYTQTNLKSRLDYVSAVCQEIELRKNYLASEKINTIYFGGGTPSLLEFADYKKIFEKLKSTFDLAGDAEITLEANPDDLSKDYLKTLTSLPFNRLSIGVQSFDDRELKFLNRRHSSKAAISAVAMAQEEGFQNISIDLMYGLPNQTMEVWEENLRQAILLNIQHISAYHLIYEEGTKLFKLFQGGKVEQVEENLSVNMFSTMIDKLSDGEFEHYEISNFAKSGLYSRHNTSYWQGKKYLGLGPAAHSFDGESRTFNVSSISKYIRGVQEGEMIMELEELNIGTKYNEFILTGLRTKWGVDLKQLEAAFGKQFLNYCLNNSQKYLVSEDLKIENEKLKLLRNGIFISDGIMSDLMWIE